MKKGSTNRIVVTERFIKNGLMLTVAELNSFIVGN